MVPMLAGPLVLTSRPSRRRGAHALQSEPLPSMCWGLLRGLPAFLLLLPSVSGLRTVPARIPCDLATDVYLTLSAGEPKFTVDAASAGCYLDRMKGYSINVPGYASGHQGDNGLTVRASFINSTHIICHLPSVTTAGNSTLVLQVRPVLEACVC